jgi:DNA-binding FadR family transcriptional regulator
MNPLHTASSRGEQIATVLRNEILSGQYRAGERLPSERDLSERFGVSRGVIREALKQLQQLGIASIQHGGARVVPVEECTLDVLGPLLELDDTPDARLVDEVMHLIGVLMSEAAEVALERATDAELVAADAILDEILAAAGEPARQFEAVRRLGNFYIEVADHLVLRLMINGLKTSFLSRMTGFALGTRHDPEDMRDILERIRKALGERNTEELTTAMRDLNRLFRTSARDALDEAKPAEQPRKQPA